MKKIAVLAVLLFLALSAHAQSPAIISYQGMLSDTAGRPIPDGVYTFEVSLWTGPDAATGTLLWTDSFEEIVSHSVFNIELGSHVPLPPAAILDRQLYVGLTINGDPHSIVRSRLSAVPMAINISDSAISAAKIRRGAVTTEKLADNSVTEAKLASGSVTPDKLGMSYLAGVTVAGDTITTKGAMLNIVGYNGVSVAYQADSNRL